MNYNSTNKRKVHPTLLLVSVIVLFAVGLFVWYWLAANANDANISSVNQSQNTQDNVDETDTEATPVQVKQGVFAGVSPKTGSGTVTLVNNVDGTYTVRLADNFTVQEGPDLYLGFANDGQVAQEALFTTLNSFSGAQEYVVPSDIDVNQYGQIIVYCKEFSAVFSVADLENLVNPL